MMRKIISAAALVCALVSTFAPCVFASSSETVPMLSRDYIQYQYKSETINNNQTLLIFILVFAGTALLIPAVFYIIEKIRKALPDKPAKKK